MPGPDAGPARGRGAIIPGDWRAGIVRLARSRGELADEVAHRLTDVAPPHDLASLIDQIAKAASLKRRQWVSGDSP